MFWKRKAPVVESVAHPNMTMEKIGFHIGRFTRAVEQRKLDDERKRELQANLAHWQAMKAAYALKPGV